MPNNKIIKLLLEEYGLSDLLEQMDCTEEDVIYALLQSGYVTWERHIAEIPLPVT